MHLARNVVSLKSLSAAVALALAASGVGAAEVLCEDAIRNHMLIDDSQVSACLDAGSGNINGNPAGPNADPFLTGVGSDYELISKTDEGNAFDLAFTQVNGTGTWSFDASAWAAYSDLAIGFKFGTGNQPDEWFVYSVVDLMSSGEWAFVNVFGRGGGLSHVNLYGVAGEPPPNGVPEPAGLALFGVGALGLAAASRRSRREN